MQKVSRAKLDDSDKRGASFTFRTTKEFGRKIKEQAFMENLSEAKMIRKALILYMSNEPRKMREIIDKNPNIDDITLIHIGIPLENLKLAAKGN